VRGVAYKKLTIGVPKEILPNERRVAIVPATVQALVKKGFTVNVEEGAGVEANFANKEYEAAGAKILKANDVYNSNIVLKVGFTFSFTLYPSLCSRLVSLSVSLCIPHCTQGWFQFHSVSNIVQTL